jgi:hypothetical protein
MILPPLLSTTALAANLTTLHQFPTGTWLENLALMPNSSLLVTLVDHPEVHIVHPAGTSNLAASFPSASSVLGISALNDTYFAVAVGNVTPTNAPVEGSFGIWTLGFDCEGGLDVAKVVDLTDMSMINGITTLNPSTVLLADPWKGNVVSLDVWTGDYRVVIDDVAMKPDFNNTVLPLGVNGVRVHEKYLYFSNTVLNLVGRVEIDPDTAEAVGEVEFIAQGEEISQPDDFAVGAKGEVFLARPLADTVQRIGLDGKVEVLVKGGLGSGATSVVFGEDKKMLFLSESGLEGGVPKYGGRVVKIEL